MKKSNYVLGYVEDGYEPYGAIMSRDVWVKLVSFDSDLSMREAIKKSLSFIDEYIKKAPRNATTAIDRKTTIIRPDSLYIREKNLKFVRLCRQCGIKRDKFPNETAIVIKGLDIPFREFKRLLSISSDERLFALAHERRRY